MARQDQPDLPPYKVLQVPPGLPEGPAAREPRALRVREPLEQRALVGTWEQPAQQVQAGQLEAWAQRGRLGRREAWGRLVLPVRREG